MGFRLRDTSGRTHRLGFFGYWLLTVLIVTVLSVVFSMAFASFDSLGDGANILSVVIGYFFIVPAAIRRFHDIGWSGWLVLTLFVPIVFAVSALILFFWPGTKGENKYGGSPVPERRVSAQTAAN